MSRFHEEESLGRIYDSKLARRLLHYLRPYAGHVCLSVALLLFVAGLQVAGPFITLRAIDEYIVKGDLAGLNLIAAVFIGILVSEFVTSYVQVYLMNRTGQRIMFDLRTELFSHIQKLHLAYFDKHPVGRLITRVTTDVDVLNELFTSGVVAIFGDVFVLTGIVVAMVLINWKLALVAFLVIPLLATATIVFKRKVRSSFRWVRTCVARINSFLQENVTGIAVVQIFAQEERKFEEFKVRNGEHLQAYLQSIRYYSLFYPVVNLIGAVAVALILWYGGIQVISGALTLGSVVAFIQYSERFYRPISDLSEKFNILQGAMASSERIFTLLDTRPEVAPPECPVSSEIRGGIEFNSVGFSYDGRHPVLEGITFSVKPGEKVAIVGATGSGKSTIINLLSRFYDVQDGRICIDGVDVRERDLTELRRSMAVVLQDVFIFGGTIRDNIGLWGGQLEEDEIQEAARRVHIHDFIMGLPAGYSTPVAERGASLSVGQRQLLAFARALAHDPRILILDEATSSIDTETEVLIQEALNELMKDRTCLIVAHRLSTIQNCDRIIVLHQGRIREVGTHSQLVSAGGIYFKLYQLQYKEQALRETVGRFES